VEIARYPDKYVSILLLVLSKLGRTCGNSPLGPSGVYIPLSRVYLAVFRFLFFCFCVLSFQGKKGRRREAPHLAIRSGRGSGHGHTQDRVNAV